MSASELRLPVPELGAEVSALLERSASARCLLALAHGAGAGMRHRFLEALARRLGERGVASLRYQFPYMEKGGGRPDPPRVLASTVRAALAAAAVHAAGLPLLAGGKSLGGRMSSQALAGGVDAPVRGLVFFGFPLHAPGKPGLERAAHLEQVQLPLLFLQGTRDSLADLELVRSVCERLGARATLHVVESADHSFRVLRRSGRSDDAALDELADVTAAWAERVAARA